MSDRSPRRETRRFSPADRSSLLGVVARAQAARGVSTPTESREELVAFVERITRGRVEQAMRWLESRRRSRAEIRRIDREVLAATERAS